MLAFFKKLSLESGSEVSQVVPGSPGSPVIHGSSIATVASTPSGSISQLGYRDNNDLKETIYDFLRTIRDPEKPATLEDLNVVYMDGIFVKTPTPDNIQVIRVEFNPTVPHCSLATLIGLCIRIKIERSIHHLIKLDIFIKKGAHTTEDEINKQINDKERIAAAMENPNLRDLVEKCIKDEE